METALAALSALGVSGIVGTVVARYVRPKATPAEELQQVREDRAEDRAELTALRAEFRILLDYVHGLRDDIANDKGPPPRPWPEGLRQ